MANLISSYIQLDEEPNEVYAQEENILNLDSELSFQRQMLIHTQPIYLINTSKLQTSQQQVAAGNKTNLSIPSEQHTTISSDNNLQELLHKRNELYEKTTYTPDSEEYLEPFDKGFNPFDMIMPIPRVICEDRLNYEYGPAAITDDELSYDYEPVAVADDELLLQLAASGSSLPSLQLISNYNQAIDPALVRSFEPSVNPDRDVHTAAYNDSATINSSKQYEFMHTLTSKLSRYCGYFVADSKEVEYFDKIRQQEIEYRFCKTYFV